MREGHLSTCLKLASCGANIDLVDNNGQTPLYYSIKHGRYDICEYLLKNNARVNIQDKKSISPIQWAKSKNKHQMIDLLVQYGATPLNDNKKNK